MPNWDDTARTFGHVVDVDEQLANVAETLPAMRDELATLQDQLARDRKTLDQVKAKIAERGAKNHQAAADGRPVIDATDLYRTRDRLTGMIAVREKAVMDTSPTFNKRTRTVEALWVEKSIRDRLAPDELAAENEARIRRLARVQFGSGVETAVRQTINRDPVTPGLSPVTTSPDTSPTTDDGLSF